MAKYGNKYVEVDDDAEEEERGGNRERGPIARRKRNGIRSGNESGSQDGQHSRNNNVDGRGDRQTKRGLESQLTSTLDPFTQAAKMTIRNLSETQAMIQDITDIYAKYVRDVEEISEIQRRFSELEKECRDKDETISKQNAAIVVIMEAGRDRENLLKEQEKDIIEDREALKLEKGDFEKVKEIAEKRSRVLEAERRLEQEEELKALKVEQTRELEHEKKQLGLERDRLENEYGKTLTGLQADMAKISEELKVEKKRNEEGKGDLARAEAKYDDLSRAKDSFKQETKELRTRLKVMENEFGLGCQGGKFYMEKFAELSKEIEGLSVRYFKDLSGKDFVSTHDELVEADGHFASVPISSSEDSELLRIAHAQRVISGFLCDIVWQPFSSEQTLRQPGFVTNLCAVSEELGKPTSSTSGRAQRVWQALTMRALHSLSTTSEVSSDAKSPETLLSGRVGKFVSDALYVLKFLIRPPQEIQLRNDLVKLAHSAVSTWNHAQTDELQITVCPTLDIANLSDWRSQVFDSPVAPFEEGKTTDTMSSTHPRIFTLFPLVTAKKLQLVTKAAASPPGSWPEPEEEPAAEEICIHPGRGLRECSALVISGKAEEEERQAEEEQKRKHLEEVVEKEKREWAARSQKIVHSRRRSMVGSVPSSPIAQWRSDGGSRMIEE